MPILETYDPLNVPATKEDINRTRGEVLSLPINICIPEIGNILVDVDESSMEAMKEVLFGWACLDINFIEWKMADNRVVRLAEKDMGYMYEEVKEAKVKRRLHVFRETSEMKGNLEDESTILTKRDLENYKQKYQH